MKCDIDVSDMVNFYLKDNGFDGLYNESYECACVIGYLSHGLCIESDCLAGYKNKCNDECSHEGKGDWHISGVKDET